MKFFDEFAEFPCAFAPEADADWSIVAKNGPCGGECSVDIVSLVVIGVDQRWCLHAVIKHAGELLVFQVQTEHQQVLIGLGDGTLTISWKRAFELDEFYQ